MAKIEKFLYIRGLPMPTIFKKKYIEEALDYEPHDDDIILASYPKTGTIWMSYIIHQILTYGKPFSDVHHIFQKFIPFSMAVGAGGLDAMTRPRVYKHHFSLDIVKYNPKAKIIYIYRKPEDMIVSWLQFRKSYVENFDFDLFFECFLAGEVPYGDYFDHILSYLKIKDNENFLLMSYEKLLLNTEQEILRIAGFLGDEYLNAIKIDNCLLNNIIKHTSFDYMKQNLPISLGVLTNHDDAKLDFFRKGKIGDGKESLSEHQLKLLNDRAKQKMKGTEILKEWNIEK